MLIERLPPGLEDAEALIHRRTAAERRKDKWRSLYTECYDYAMPSRETFTWRTEGQNRQRQLYDSTLQEATYSAANTLVALLFPSWSRWSELAPGGAIRPEDLTPIIVGGLQKATKTFFDFLNTSNFSTVISECALDLLVGTCALSFDEGDNDQPFMFSSIPLPAIEFEEGPSGSVETNWLLRKPIARHILRLYSGLEMFDLSAATQKLIDKKPDTEVELIQGEIYYPENGHYYGVVIEVAEKHICWRYDYGKSCPKIVARATKVSGETYGRGRVMLALADAKTLDKMQEFVLRQAALQVAPPMTAVSDGVLNPFTATVTPNTIIPVASNDGGNPSIRPIELGGNFNVTEALMEGLRQRVRRTMMGPEPTEGAVRSATEISTNDRDRLWAMNGEFMRIQSELAAKIVSRGVFILQKKGIIPQFKVDGREVAVKYTSPFAKTQNAEDVMNVQEAMMIAGQTGPENVAATIRIENIPGWVFRMKGAPEDLIRTDEERDEILNQAKQAVMQMQQAQASAEQGGVEAAGAGA